MSDLTPILSSGSDAAAVIEAARTMLAAQELDPEKLQAFVLSGDARLELPDLTAWRDAPARKRGVYQPATVESFKDYVLAHAGDGSTIWVHPYNGRVEALLNDHQPDAPGWGDHRAVLLLEQTPEWRYWATWDGEMLSQERFAEHIEGGIEEVVEPDGASLLELAQNFHATSGATFRSSVRLASGQQQLQYDEEVQASAGTRGDMTVPTRFLLGVAPFTGEQPYRLAARLRFRVTAGKLTLGYFLDRPERVLRDAIEQIAEKLAESFPNTYIGTPVPV